MYVLFILLERMILFQIFNSIYICVCTKKYLKTFLKTNLQGKNVWKLYRMNLLEYIKIYHTNYEVTILQKRFIFILLDIYISETFMNVSWTVQVIL